MTTSPKRPCLCGCGGTPSPNANFLPTHDGKLNGLLTDVRERRLPGRAIPEILLEVARANKDESTCGFSHKEILEICGRVI